MSHEEVVKKTVDIVWNNAQLHSIAEFYHPNVIIHGAHGDIVGIENFKNTVQDLHIAFPDLKFKIIDIIASGNKVVIRWTATGTHKGIFLGNAPTQKKMTYQGISVFLFENNKIKEYWYETDLFGLLKQLGVLHAPAK